MKIYSCVIVGQKHCQLLTPYVSVLDQCLPESWTLSKGYHRNLKERERASKRDPQEGSGLRIQKDLQEEELDFFSYFFFICGHERKEKDGI